MVIPEFKTSVMTINNLYVIVGLSLILLAIVMLIFPPKFGNFFYGVRTKITMKNTTSWANGQKLFAYSILIFGVTFSIFSFLKIEGIIKPVPMFIFFIALWKLAEYLVHKSLANKFSEEEKKID